MAHRIQPRWHIATAATIGYIHSPYARTSGSVCQSPFAVDVYEPPKAIGTCAYCGRDREEGEKSCAGCGAAKNVKPAGG